MATQNHRYRLTFLRGGKGSAIVEALSEAAALEAAYVIPKGSKVIEGRGTVHFGQRFNEGETADPSQLSEAIIGCAVVLDRLPSDFGKGAYRTFGERTEAPQDRGGSTRKHRSPRPFAPAPRVIPETRGRNGQTLEKVIPSSGVTPNRAESAAAQRELARAGLGTLNGVAVGGPMNVNPEHYCGVRTVKHASSAPLAIIAARVTPCTDAVSAARAQAGGVADDRVAPLRPVRSPQLRH